MVGQTLSDQRTDMLGQVMTERASRQQLRTLDRAAGQHELPRLKIPRFARQGITREHLQVILIQSLDIFDIVVEKQPQPPAVAARIFVR